MKYKNKEKIVVNFLGDSITEGHGASIIEKRYSTIACNILGATENNYGVAGTRIAPQYSVSENPRYDLDFNMRLSQMKTCDVVVIYGGTNDFGHGDAPFGSQTDTTKETFCGALYSLFAGVKKRYPNQPVLVILPLHRREEDNDHKCVKIRGEAPILKCYKEEINRQARAFGYDVLDLWEDPRFNPHRREGENNFADQLHPSDEGHKLLGEIVANKIAEIIKEK